MFVFGLLLIGCTQAVVRKDPGPHDPGFRFYRPKPYLFIGPMEADDKKAGDTAAAPAKAAPKATPAKGQGQKKPTVGPPTEADQKIGELEDRVNELHAIVNEKVSDGPDAPAAPAASIKVTMQIKYMPDWNEEYSVRLRSGLGTGKLEFKLDDGWNLTSVGIETDQKIPELLNAIANLAGVAQGAKPAAAAAAGQKKPGVVPADANLFIVDTRPDVPLGFYEPIIATDTHGRKSLFGWRYVGFMPFAGCPVDVCVQPRTVTCDVAELWGLVAATGSLKFQRLSEIEAGANPYQYRKFEPAVHGAPAPPPGANPVKKEAVPGADPDATADESARAVRR
ncbi:hypothetical protein FRUB_02152 [Fimbriiglobus ruber]|uniref:Uncharacterized protein n=1 Tax=Fimbriiglobus ruber TaxID=1908690 RepID=A0A225DWU4_9BACT|nr:hypothetical protein FRUB_02152 [Fimbriiglobus ruber]